MSVNRSPKLVSDSQQIFLDAANVRSYPGSGTTWFDLSGNNNDGTLTNGPTFDTNYNGSILFDGVNDTVDCGAVPKIGSSLTALTVSAWVRPTTAATKCILENGTTFNTNTFYLFQENASNFSFSVFGSGQDLIQTPGTYSLNVWYNLVGVWSSGKRLKFYSNGIESTGGVTTGSAQTSLINGNTNLFIGARAWSSFQFAGNISCVNIYNRVLSADEILQNFNAFRGRYGI